MAKSNAVYVGMDVRKDSIDIALADAGARGGARHYGTIGGGLGDVLGHSNVGTTMVYTHVLNKGGRGVTSPLDRL